MPRRSGTATFARRLGSRIRAIRKETGITQERLAWDCNLNKGYVSQVEAGKRVPSIPAIVAFAKRLGVEVVDLLGFDLSKPRLQLLDAARRANREEVREVLRRLELG